MNVETRLTTFKYQKDLAMEYTNAKTYPGADCSSDLKLLAMDVRIKL